MGNQLFKGVVLGAVTSTLVLIAASAVAGTGPGAVFNLGRTNQVNAVSTLKGRTAGKNLQLTNTGAGSALGLKVTAGHTPMTVNSAVKVTRLNADKLDGLNSTDFLGADAKASDADELDNLDSSAFARTTSEAWHMVGAPGEPPFTDSCGTASWINWNFGGTAFNEVGFYKDSGGVVHLKGLAAQWCGGGNGAGTTIFTLPAGYRPLETELQVTLSNNAVNRLNVNANGTVVPELAVGSASGQWISLDGISFRAEN